MGNLNDVILFSLCDMFSLMVLL